MKSQLAAALVTSLLVGCARRPEPETDHEARSAASAEHAGDEHRDEGSASIVRIDPGMLRDLRITTANVESRPGTESAPVPAELRVPDSAYAEVGSPIGARAVRVLVTAGEPVRRGQVLAELQSLELAKARGEYAEAEVRSELARKGLARKRGLAEERIAPVREVQEAEAELRSADAALASSRAGLEAMGVSISGDGGASLRLHAPLEGTVIEKALVQGQVIEPAQTLFRIGSLFSLWLIAHAPERDAVRVALQAEARVAIPALPGKALSARVVLVGSQVEMSSRTIPVRLEVPNTGGELRPGMSATVWLPVGDGTSVLAVPAGALQRLGDKWCVFLPHGGGAFEARIVGRGRDLGGETEILSGLDAGDTIVVEGAFLLKAEAEKARGEGGSHEH